MNSQSGRFFLWIFFVFFLIQPGSSQDFIINDVLVSADDAEIDDIEMDPFKKRICWQSADDNKLWVCRLDTITWELVDPYGMETLIDTALTSLSQTSNGGEWGFDQNFSYIVYNKLITLPSNSCNKVRYIAVATETQSGWMLCTLFDAPHRINPHASTNPADSVVAIHYIRNQFSINTKYKFLNDPYNEMAVTCFKDAHWGLDEQVLTGILHNKQVGLFDPANPTIPVELTKDTANDYSIPFIWRAPEHGNARMFFARVNEEEIMVLKEMQPASNKFQLYMKFDSPSLNLQYKKIASPEPVVYKGQSYITFMASSSPHENASVPAEIWIVKLDSVEPVFRMISDTTVAIRTDPESFPTDSRLLAFYTEIVNPDSVNRISRVHKCETGFGPGFITGNFKPDGFQGNTYHVCPNPFRSSIRLLDPAGGEHFMLADFLGKTVWSGNELAGKDFSGLRSGLYFLKIHSEEHTQTLSVIKTSD